MAIGDLNRKISSTDKEKLRSTRNHPEFEMGFEEEDDAFASLFDTDEDGGIAINDSFDSLSSFGNSGVGNSSPGFGNSSPGFGSNNPGFGNNSPGFGSPGFGSPGFGSPGFGQNNFGLNSFDNTNMNGQAIQTKPDTFDKMLDGLIAGFSATCNVLVQSISSVKTRTADDWGYYCTKMIKVAAVILIISVMLSICAIVGGLSTLGIGGGLSFELLISSLLIAGIGLMGLGVSALYIEQYNNSAVNSANDLPDIAPSSMSSNEEYEDSMDDLIDDLFGDWDSDDTDDGYEDNGDDWLGGWDDEPEPEPETPPEPPNLDNLINDVNANQVGLMNRGLLVDTFKPFFPRNTAGFSKRILIENGSETFNNLETLALKALANANKIDYEDMIGKSQLEEAYETFFTYELRILRVKGLNKLDDIEREMVTYFRESSEDTSVSCKCDLEGDFYKVTINKGNSAIVTLGDMLDLDEVDKYIRNTKNKIPIIAGMKIDGRPILTDAKTLDSMLIAGKPRSGKSWYVLQLLITMMAFNSPETVQFVIIDPKSSNMFNTMKVMPHVCGVHTDEKIMRIMRDIIDGEGARRKKLLADNKCENIWQLRDKGIEVPILYLVIDEVMTVLANLGDTKEFFELIKVIVTQLPSQGIRLMMVPHRSSGVVDKTVRMNIPFITAVKAANEVVLETLGLKKWNIPLEKPGDMALYIQGVTEGVFARGPAVTPEDETNNELMIAIAKAYYKMGVELPDMKSIGCAYNRNEDEIRETLQLSVRRTNKVQFDFEKETQKIDLDKAYDDEFSDFNNL